MIDASLQLALDSAPFLLKGAYFTVFLSLGGMFFGLLIGFGLALMRLPLVADALSDGRLREVFPQRRLDSPLAYWLLTGPRSGQRPEVQAFAQWLQQQAHDTRQAMAPVDDPA